MASRRSEKIASTFAAGLVALALAHSQANLWFAWLVLGVGMGLGLYDTAFATLGRIYGTNARSAITGITLIAGFASTVGWPLTAWGASELGWRGTCIAWAAAHLLIGLPLNRFLLPKPSNIVVSPEASGKPHVPLDRTMITLGLAFACSWMVVAAMAVHLPRLPPAPGHGSLFDDCGGVVRRIGVVGRSIACVGFAAVAPGAPQHLWKHGGRLCCP